MRTSRRNNSGANGILSLIFCAAALIFAAYAHQKFYKAVYPLGYTDIITECAARENLPPELVYAVCYTESGFRPNAVSSVGARGVMQLTEETFTWVKSKTEPNAATSYDDLYDPATNIRYGSALLRILCEEFGSVNNALAAYHAGWGSATRWLADERYSTNGTIDNIPFGDTDAYVKKVGDVARIYKKLYGNNLLG